MATFAMAMLVCGDLARSRAFYRDQLSLPLGTDAVPHWVDFDLGGGGRLGLHPSAPHMPVAPGSASLGFHVDDVDALVERLRADGVPIVSEPHDQDFGRLAVISDPDGYAVQVISPKHA
jgi:predicted enzyme related to lactoylglutathione lyase